MNLSLSFVTGGTQNGKTSKTFDIISSEKGDDDKKVKTCLFVTQANCTNATKQTLHRASESEKFKELFDGFYTCEDIISNSKNIKNTNNKNENKILEVKKDMINKYQAKETNNKKYSSFVVDFWHKHNIDGMLLFIDFVCTTFREKSHKIMIVIDECDQGGVQGVKTRFEFIKELYNILNHFEKKYKEKNQIYLQLIFVTATVPHFCKCLYIIYINLTLGDDSGTQLHPIYEFLLKGRKWQYFYVSPHDNYVGPSWFVKENKDRWYRIERPEVMYRTKMKELKKEEHHNLDEIRKSVRHESDEMFKKNIFQVLKKRNEKDKKLCLFVFSSRMKEQEEYNKHLFDCGFNVIVKMNSKIVSQYEIIYEREEKEGEERKRNKGKWCLSFDDIDHCLKLESLDSLSLPYILQATLCINVNHEIDENIKTRIDDIEWKRLMILNKIICSTISHPRPKDYPKNPHIVLVAGQIAGRGNTLQLSKIDFVFSCVCFIGKIDKMHRGAQNAQKFGRACGLLKDVFTDDERKPYLITTQNIFEDALSNEEILKKNKDFNETYVSLRDFITDEEWNKIVSKTHKKLNKINHSRSKIDEESETHDINRNANGNVYNEILKLLNAYPNGLTVNEMKDINPELHTVLQRRHNAQINTLYYKFGFIEKQDRKWKITNFGKQQL